MKRIVVYTLPAISLLISCVDANEPFRSSMVEFDFPADWAISADSTGGSLFVELISSDSNSVLLTAMQGVMPPEFILDGFWANYSRSLPSSLQIEKSDSIRICYFAGVEARCLDYIFDSGGIAMQGTMYCFNASGNTYTLQRYASQSALKSFIENSEIIENTIYFP
jgi:hypothetical protein